MANTLLTISMITKEALRVLENDLAFTKGVNRTYDSYFAKSGAKIGSTLNVRKPPRYVGSTGKALAVEDSVETSVPITLDQQFHVDMEFSSQDFALSIDEFSDRFIKPAVAAIANRVDFLGLQMAKKIPNAVGDAATLANTLKVFLDAGAKMDAEGAPRDGQRSVVIGPYTQAGLVDNLKGLFQSSDKIADQYESGNMGVTGGFKFSMDQNVPQFTFGSAVATGMTVNGAGQAGATLTIAGMGAGNKLVAGDVFTIAGVFAVNPQSRQSTGKLRQFTVVTDSAVAGTSLTIAPAIVGPATPQFQNVSALPANGAALVFTGTAGAQVELGLAYHKDAFALVCADLPLPTGDAVQASRASDDQLGLSIRMVRQYNINTDTFPCRLDILFGWATLYPELACKVISNTSV